jgi:hypothetical protein
MDTEDEEDAQTDSKDTELPILTPEQLDAESADELKRDLTLLEGEKNKLKGNVNMNALLDYLRKDANYK